MGQMGFDDLDKRLEAISAKGDPLELIKATVPWESFRAEIEAVTRAKPEERKSAAGRKPYDAMLSRSWCCRLCTIRPTSRSNT
jgi:rubredoxin